MHILSTCGICDDGRSGGVLDKVIGPGNGIALCAGCVSSYWDMARSVVAVSLGDSPPPPEAAITHALVRDEQMVGSAVQAGDIVWIEGPPVCDWFSLPMPAGVCGFCGRHEACSGLGSGGICVRCAQAARLLLRPELGMELDPMSVYVVEMMDGSLAEFRTMDEMSAHFGGPEGLVEHIDKVSNRTVRR